MKVKDLPALIESGGWVQVRQRGGHRQFHHPIKQGTVAVAGKPSVDVPPDTLNSVLKQAGLKKQVLRMEFHIEGLKEEDLSLPPPHSSSEFVEVRA